MNPSDLKPNTIYHCKGNKLRKFLRAFIDSDAERMALCRDGDSGINHSEPIDAFARTCLRERAPVRTALVKGTR